MGCLSRSHCVLLDLQFLLTRRSHQLTQSRSRCCTACSHHDRPRCPSSIFFVLARVHVWLCQEFRVNQSDTCSCSSLPALLAVTSAHVSLLQVALFSTLSLLSAVEPHLPWPWPSRFTTIPVSTRFSSRTHQRDRMPDTIRRSERMLRYHARSGDKDKSSQVRLTR